MLQHDFYPCCGIDHPPNEGAGEKCKTSGLFVAMQNTAAGRKQARPAVSRGSRDQHKPGILYFTHQNQSGKLQKGYRKTFQSFHTCTDYDIMKNGKFHTILKSKFVLIKLYLSPSRPSQYRGPDDQIPCPE